MLALQEGYSAVRFCVMRRHAAGSDLQIYLTIQDRNHGAIGAIFQNPVSERRGTAVDAKY